VVRLPCHCVVAHGHPYAALPDLNNAAKRASRLKKGAPALGPLHLKVQFHCVSFEHHGIAGVWSHCCSIALLLCYSVTLLLCWSVALFLCSSVSLFLCSSVPLLLCSSFALFLCCSVALFLCSSVPLFLCCSIVALLLYCFWCLGHVENAPCLCRACTVCGAPSLPLCGCSWPPLRCPPNARSPNPACWH